MDWLSDRIDLYIEYWLLIRRSPLQIIKLNINKCYIFFLLLKTYKKQINMKHKKIWILDTNETGQVWHVFKLFVVVVVVVNNSNICIYICVCACLLYYKPKARHLSWLSISFFFRSKNICSLNLFKYLIINNKVFIKNKQKLIKEIKNLLLFF